MARTLCDSICSLQMFHLCLRILFFKSLQYGKQEKDLLYNWILCVFLFVFIIC